jgi:hypothetical protein
MMLQNDRLKPDWRISFFFQCACILFPFAFFFDAAILRRGRINLSWPEAVLWLLFLNGALFLTVFLAAKVYLASKKRDKAISPIHPSTRKKIVMTYAPIMAVASVFTFLAGLQFDTIQRFDGGLYYDALMTGTENFSYSFSSYVSSFILWEHPLQGTSLLIGAGEMLFPRQSVGVYGVTLLVTLIAIFCSYGIMGRILPGKAPWLLAAGTAVFAFSPYVLGLFSHLSADYFTLMFFIIFVYCFSREWDYLAAFLALLLVFSKETGILFAASFLIPAMLIRAGKEEGKNIFTRWKKYLIPKRLILYAVAPLLFISYTFLLKGLTFGVDSNKKSVFRWDSEGIHCFGFNIGYISVRILQNLVFNFAWITMLLLFVAVTLYFLRRWKSKDKIPADTLTDPALLLGVMISSLAYLIFSCLFITIACPRYAVCFAFPLALLCVGTVSYIWKRPWIMKIVMSAIIALLLVQNYYNIDPTLSMGNHALDLGRTKIYTPTGDFSNMDIVFLGDVYAYNRTFCYADDLLDQAMEKINPDEEDWFYFIGIDWYEIYLIGDPLQTDHLIYWDSIHQRRTYDNSGSGTFLPNIEMITKKNLFSDESLLLPDDFYLILSARKAEQDYSGQLVRRGYTITDSFRVENCIGYLMVYHFSGESLV